MQAQDNPPTDSLYHVWIGHDGNEDGVSWEVYRYVVKGAEGFDVLEGDAKMADYIRCGVATLNEACEIADAIAPNS